MSGRGRRSRGRGRGRRGRGRRNIQRMTRTVINAELHGGSLPRRMPTLPPPHGAGSSTYAINLRSVFQVAIDKGKNYNGFYAFTSAITKSNTYPLSYLLSTYTYARMRYADVWFMPKHGTNSAGLYTFRLLSSELQDSWNPDQPSSFEYAAMTGSLIRKSFQSAHQRFHFYSESSCNYRPLPVRAKTQTGSDDLFHIFITNNADGITDPNNGAGNKYLYGRLVVDAKWDFKEFRAAAIAPPAFSNPIEIGDDFFSYGAIRVGPSQIPSIQATLSAHFNADTGDSWYDQMFRVTDVMRGTTAYSYQMLSYINSLVERMQQSSIPWHAELMKLLREILDKIPKPSCVDGAGPSRDHDFEMLEKPSSQ